MDTRGGGRASSTDPGIPWVAFLRVWTPVVAITLVVVFLLDRSSSILRAMTYAASLPLGLAIANAVHHRQVFRSRQGLDR